MPAVRRLCPPLAVLVTWFVASASWAADAAPDARRLAAAIDAWVKPLVEQDQLSGQLLVARAGKVLLERNYGFADWESRTPVTADTRFCIASVTKPMTGTIALQLLAERKIGLKDSIARWLPSFPKGDRITIELLLRHRSGIPHLLLPDSEATRPMSAAAMTEIAARRPLDFEPGTKDSYSSGGFTVLTRVLELATAKGYAELLEERIFGPLGMKHSSDHDSRALLPGRARPVVPGARGLVNAEYEDFSHIVGAGSVWSTARDLERFVSAVATGRLGVGPTYSYVRSGKLEFNGMAGGFRAFCDWDTVSGITVIFAGNLQTGAPDLLRKAVPLLAAGKPAPPPPALPKVAASPSPADLARYEGTFRLGNGTVLELRVRDGALWANEWVLLPAAEGGFFSPRDYGRVRGVAGADGRIERLDWEQRGEVHPAPRVSPGR